VLDKTADQITYILLYDEIKCNKRKVFYPVFQKKCGAKLLNNFTNC